MKIATAFKSFYVDVDFSFDPILDQNLNFFSCNISNWSSYLGAVLMSLHRNESSVDGHKEIVFPLLSDGNRIPTFDQHYGHYSQPVQQPVYPAQEIVFPIMYSEPRHPHQHDGHYNQPDQQPVRPHKEIVFPIIQTGPRYPNYNPHYGRYDLPPQLQPRKN